uniref:Ovule protein n=1 Tax=Strongyloides venezuelensis TaxID=75913 RepID=A0A0K0FEX6_STRVS
MKEWTKKSAAKKISKRRSPSKKSTPQRSTTKKSSGRRPFQDLNQQLEDLQQQKTTPKKLLPGQPKKPEPSLRSLTGSSPRTTPRKPSIQTKKLAFDFDFSNPENNFSHYRDFRQLLWDVSKRIRCGVSKTNKDVFFAVCLFYPKENKEGEYKWNVH